VYFSASEIRGAAGMSASAANEALRRESQNIRKGYPQTWDVFLSHCRLDADVVLGLKRILEASHLSVYVDWVDDPELDRANVTPATADRLRQRMTASRSLIYAYSRSAARSVWMPWELGYFDGKRGSAQIAVCPIEDAHPVANGQEYLGLYQTFEKIPYAGGHQKVLISPSRRDTQSPRLFARN